MKVYLASRYSTKETIREYAAQLRAMGIEVTSRWLEEPHAPTTGMDDLPAATHAYYAVEDIVDVNECDWLVFFSVDPTLAVVRGGRHVEFGYALGKKKDVLVVGPHENVFHYLPQVSHVDTWEEAKEFLDAHH